MDGIANNMKKKDHVFVGFGFGPIQAGFFVPEAISSGTFLRITIAEVDSRLVEAIRSNNGSYYVNIAYKDGIRAVRIDGVEILNSTLDRDSGILREALSAATEIVTSLPSVVFYTAGHNNSVAALIAEGLQESEKVPATFIYTAENNNYAAEILEKSVSEFINKPVNHFVQYVNTVIGKMSQVVTDPEKINRMKLQPIAPGIDRAFLVEEFDQILINRNKILGFKMGH